MAKSKFRHLDDFEQTAFGGATEDAQILECTLGGLDSEVIIDVGRAEIHQSLEDIGEEEIVLVLFPPDGKEEFDGLELLFLKRLFVFLEDSELARDVHNDIIRELGFKGRQS